MLLVVWRAESFLMCFVLSLFLFPLRSVAAAAGRTQTAISQRKDETKGNKQETTQREKREGGIGWLWGHAKW